MKVEPLTDEQAKAYGVTPTKPSLLNLAYQEDDVSVIDTGKITRAERQEGKTITYHVYQINMGDKTVFVEAPNYTGDKSYLSKEKEAFFKQIINSVNEEKRKALLRRSEDLIRQIQETRKE